MTEHHHPCDLCGSMLACHAEQPCGWDEHPSTRSPLLCEVCREEGVTIYEPEDDASSEEDDDPADPPE